MQATFNMRQHATCYVPDTTYSMQRTSRRMRICSEQGTHHRCHICTGRGSPPCHMHRTGLGAASGCIWTTEGCHGALDSQCGHGRTKPPRIHPGFPACTCRALSSRLLCVRAFPRTHVLAAMAEGNHGVSIQPFSSRNNAQRGACRARLAGTATLVVR